MASKNPLNGHPFDDIEPLYPRCCDLIEKLKKIIESDSKIDEQQSKSIKEIFKILKTKADKDAVAKALTELAEDMYDNFYTKEEVDEKLFSAIVVDELPENGEVTKLYLVEDKEKGGYDKFVFSGGQAVYLGYTNCLSVHDFAEFLKYYEDTLEEIQKNFDLLQQEIDDIASGCTSAITSALTELYDEIMKEVNTILEDYVTYSALTEMRESILEEVADELLNYATKVELESGLTEVYEASNRETQRVKQEIIEIIDGLEEKTEKEFDEIRDYLDQLATPVEYQMLEQRVRVVEDKLERYMYRGLENTVIERNIVSGKDILVTGSTVATAKITAPNITLKDLTISEQARLTLLAGDDILVKNVDFDGDFGSRVGGASIVSLNSGYDVTVKNTFFNTPDTPVADTQNGIAIGLTRVPKNITIDNVDFSNKFKNIPLIIYGVQDDSVINISNVHFAKVKNCIRFSNYENATGVTINITNCTCDQWSQDDEWSGFMVFEDYKSFSSEVETNNLFGDGKVTVNIHNLRYQGEIVQNPENIADVCGTAVYPTQLFYMYATKKNEFIGYDESRWPKINII